MYHYSKGQGHQGHQGHAHFELEYLWNGNGNGKQYYRRIVVTQAIVYTGFWLAYLHSIMANCNRQDQSGELGNVAV